MSAQNRASRQKSERSKTVIVHYLNYVHKQLILQKFRRKRTLQIKGQDFFLFADYSAEVSHCTALFQHIYNIFSSFSLTLLSSTSQCQKVRG
ncbi:hypothetical protein AB205_0147310 [Aquarana catesbeiana]|uniref:Uncharacterized protein n=1 Tax=Aquarana catesbeiana TaxID=8400 RepID=A0A2G9SBC1_AQUCT|nr:hypothetical protein AB205_0147310 [Aquarana catesbeiana]